MPAVDLARKLNSRDERKLIRTLNLLRKEKGQFSSKRLMERAGIQESQVSGNRLTSSGPLFN